MSFGSYSARGKWRQKTLTEMHGSKATTLWNHRAAVSVGLDVNVHGVMEEKEEKEKRGGRRGRRGGGG